VDTRTAAKENYTQAAPILLIVIGKTGDTEANKTKTSGESPYWRKYMNQKNRLEVATLAGGCFWCIEAVFKEVDGVEKVVSGYTGGMTINPTYEQVSNGSTGHAESIQVYFDPVKISYREILEIFFSVHDPTTLNWQGADVGTQYRSAIFYGGDRQRAVSEEIISDLNKKHLWKNAIVTQVVPLSVFYPAEDYHQEYFARHPEQAYCQVVIAPKVSKFRKQWSTRLKN
jgi:peptide-methionine (S)-S-oxide reductase